MKSDRIKNWPKDERPREKLLARVVRHKRTYFQSAWANYDAAKPGSLRLVPPAHRLADLKTDYQQMRAMFTEPPPPFDDILRQLTLIEETLNKRSSTTGHGLDGAGPQEYSENTCDQERKQ